jgi:integrase
MLNPRLAISKSGLWEVRFTERDEEAGRYRSKSVSCRTADRTAAEAFLVGLLDAEEHASRSSHAPMIAELIDEYGAAAKANKKGETQQICLRHLKREFGAVRLLDLTPTKIIRYRQKRGVKDSTLRRELETLRVALNYAVKIKRIRHDDIPHIELPRQTQARRVYLADAEERAFYERALAHSDGSKRLSRLARFVAIALDTGARAGAIRGLTWGRVDLAASRIDFHEAGRQVHNKRRALVPISRRLRPVLERAFKERKTGFVLDHPGEIKKTWQRFVATTPHPDLHIHDLRRTFATLAISNGVSVVTVANILGDDPTTVLKHYAQFIPGEAQTAVDVRWGEDY